MFVYTFSLCYLTSLSMCPEASAFWYIMLFRIYAKKCRGSAALTHCCEVTNVDSSKLKVCDSFCVVFIYFLSYQHH